MTLSLYGGSWASESAANNPFMNYRLTTTFTSGSSGRMYSIPCSWAADGRAAHSGATAGSVWRCLFTPDVTGLWRWSVAFKSGTNVAVRSGGGGAPVSPFDGQTGSFRVRKSNKTGRDFRGKGRLRPVTGKRHLRHENGECFMKHGADSPENLLGYSGFDNTPKARHDYAPHRRDWRGGDPAWAKDRRGKAIVGANTFTWYRLGSTRCTPCPLPSAETSKTLGLGRRSAECGGTMYPSSTSGASFSST